MLLVGDIDRGGVFAALVGTLELLEPDGPRARRGASSINKFRGDARCSRPGSTFLRGADRRAGAGRRALPARPRICRTRTRSALDSRAPRRLRRTRARVDIAVIGCRASPTSTTSSRWPAEPGVARALCRATPTTSACRTWSILPGHEEHARRSRLAARARLAERAAPGRARASRCSGICGGYQMLGTRLPDPDGVEGATGEGAGLGLLPWRRCSARTRRPAGVSGEVLAQAGFFGCLGGFGLAGYEIHLGRHHGAAAPFARLARVRTWLDGAVSADGTGGRDVPARALPQRRRAPRARRRAGPAARPGPGGRRAAGRRPYDRLADAVAESVDLAAVCSLWARRPGRPVASGRRRRGPRGRRPSRRAGRRRPGRRAAVGGAG